jgi:hypothetical protein
VLDNCEHVLAHAAALVAAIARGCGLVRVLATSRERLEVDGEQVLVVEPLSAAAGAELFNARAAAADPAFDPAAAPAAVEELCRHLDGIPLAIELAAARARTLRPADLLARLGDGLPLTGARRTGAARHRTVQAAIQWSYEPLTAAQRALFERLSVFAAPFELAAAEAVGGDGPCGAVLDDLVGRSMVAVVAGPSGRRFRLRAPSRGCAAERPRDGGGAWSGYARWCAAESGAVGRLLRGPEEIAGVVRLGELWPHLRATVGWACAGGDPGLADALVRPVVTELPLRGRQEIGVWAERIVTAGHDRRSRAPGASGASDRPEVPDPAVWLLLAAERHNQNANPAAFRAFADQAGLSGSLAGYAAAYSAGDGHRLRHHLEGAVAQLRAGGEPFLAEFLYLASAGLLVGAFAEVDAAVGAQAERLRREGPPALLHWALQTLAYSASFQGRREHADACFDEAAHIALPPGTLSANLTAEARSAFRRGEPDLALRLLHAYAGEMLDADNVIAAVVVAIEFVNIAAGVGAGDQAAAMLGYLEGANDFGALAARTLTAEAAARVGHRRPGTRFDDRAALRYMRAALADLMIASTPHAARNDSHASGTPNSPSTQIIQPPAPAPVTKSSR